MKRVIVTGANGSGKSHFARRLGACRPDCPVISFDAIKLTQNWQQRPRPEIDADLAEAVAQEAWILEGGPSLLPIALPRADAVIWLRPPEVTRAWRLLLRPWRGYGKTRPELPDGNPDWPLTQYRFAWRSLRSARKFHGAIQHYLENAPDVPVLICRTQRQVDHAFSAWAQCDIKALSV